MIRRTNIGSKVILQMEMENEMQNPSLKGCTLGTMLKKLAF